MLKKVVRHSAATALASIVLPVPGGPNKRIPFHGSKIPSKKCGNFKGINTASFNNLLASSKPTISGNLTPGSIFIISF